MSIAQIVLVSWERAHATHLLPRKILCNSHAQDVISVVPSRTVDVRYPLGHIRQDAWTGDGEVPKKKRKSSWVLVAARMLGFWQKRNN